MPDDKSKTGRQDRRLVNIHQAHELRYWSKRFRCSQLCLVLAAGSLGVGIEHSVANVGSAIRYARMQVAAASKRARKRGRR